MAIKSLRSKEEARVEMTSMTDMVFLLLTFFMIGYNFLPLDDKLDVKLPDSRAVSKQTHKPNIVEINVEKQVFFDGVLVTYGELERKLDEVGKDATVIIKADKRITHGDVVRVMGILKYKNIKNVGIAALLRE
ncbi:MAG: biopolymer transporter ExbD [bacterium]|nr:biopolymer transporter ExbD [bacterium]